jgi:hypothetical protein
MMAAGSVDQTNNYVFEITPRGLFEVKDATFMDVVSELSLKPIEGLHLGVEEILRETVPDSPAETPRFSLLLHNNNVREILNAIRGDGRYMWSQDGRTINIYPKSTLDDEAYLLIRNLELNT